MGQIMVYVVVCTIAVFGFAILLAQFLEYLQANKEIGFQDDDDDEGPPWNTTKGLSLPNQRYLNDSEYRRQVDSVTSAKSMMRENIYTVNDNLIKQLT